MNAKNLMARLNRVSSRYFGRIMYALFLLSVLETFSSFIVFSPAMRLASSGAGSISVRILTILFAFLAICVWLTFQFGFAVMLLKMTRSEYSNLGFLFVGFRLFNHAGKVIVPFAFSLSVIAVLSSFATKLIFRKIRPNFSFELPGDFSENQEFLSAFAIDAVTFLAIFLGILFVLSIFALIRFVFAFQLHFDNPNIPILAIFKKSFKMMDKNVFRLIFFALHSGGKQLCIAIFLAILANFIPEDKSSGLSLLTFIIDMIYLINLYTAMIRIYLTVPVLYEEILNPSQKTETQTETQTEMQAKTEKNTD